VLAGIATLGYGACVFGFGLVFRPLESDESVTLQVASLDSVRGVLDAAVNYRHGPPLHYLLVHASLAVRDDVFGLRLPSALLGMVAVGLAYGFGRELLGRVEGSVMAVIVATSPMVVHLGQFARGYTAMLSASFLSLWLMLILLRTRQFRWAIAWGVSVLLLAGSHPFGLFALFSELILLAVLGLWPLLRDRSGSRRPLIATGVALVLGAAALLALRGTPLGPRLVLLRGRLRLGLLGLGLSRGTGTAALAAASTAAAAAALLLGGIGWRARLGGLRVYVVGRCRCRRVRRAGALVSRRLLPPEPSKQVDSPCRARALPRPGVGRSARCNVGKTVGIAVTAG